MVKSLYKDPIDWDSPELLRIQSTVVLLCEHVFNREDVNNTYKSNGYTEFFFLEIYEGVSKSFEPQAFSPFR